MQTDPIGYGDGTNWYAYAQNDPVNRKDPTGLDTATLSDGASCDFDHSVDENGSQTIINLHCINGSDGTSYYDIIMKWEIANNWPIIVDGVAYRPDPFVSFEQLGQVVAALQQSIGQGFAGVSASLGQALTNPNNCKAATGPNAVDENFYGNIAASSDLGATAAAVTGSEEVAVPLEGLSWGTTGIKMLDQFGRRDYLGGMASFTSALTSGVAGAAWKALPAGDLAEKQFRNSASAAIGYATGKSTDSILDCK